MKLWNRDLILTRDELINMIRTDNPDKNDWSNEILVKMITNFKYLSKKQYEWILSKVKYIINHNNKYMNYKKKVKGFELED